MKPSEFKISHSVESYDEKFLKITKIATLPKSAQFSNHQKYRYQISITQIEHLNKDYVNMLVSILRGLMWGSLSDSVFNFFHPVMIQLYYLLISTREAF